MAYTIVKRLFDLSIGEPHEIGWNQAFTSDENENYQPNSPRGGGSVKLEDRE